MAKSRHRGRRRRRPREVGSRPTRKDTSAQFCEGRRTEPEYLKAFRRRYGMGALAAPRFLGYPSMRSAVVWSRTVPDGNQRSHVPPHNRVGAPQ